MDIITKRITFHSITDTRKKGNKAHYLSPLSSFFLMSSFILYKCLLLLSLVITVCLANKEAEMEQPTKLLGGKSTSQPPTSFDHFSSRCPTQARKMWIQGIHFFHCQVALSCSCLGTGYIFRKYIPTRGSYRIQTG